MITGLSPDLESILLAGNQAPSGENCQPWRFVVRGTTIAIHLLSERDRSAYSWGQRSSYLAGGAVIENMVIEASAQGYRADVVYFPDRNDVWHVADVVLNKGSGIKADPLAVFIEKRITNRKPYAKASLTHEERAALLAVVAQDGCRFTLVEKKENIQRLGRVGSTNEEVMLTNHLLHQFFFSHVSWTEEEDDAKKVGFYIKTLELPPPAQAMFKLFKNWPAMRIFSALGFPKIIAKQNAATNASASAIGAFMLDRTEPLDFVKIGRMIERLWLTATSLGLSVQPLTGVLFFKLKIDAGEHAVFSPHEQRLISDAYQDASRICNAEGKSLVFMLRIGRGDAPSAQAVRFPLEDVVSLLP